LASWEPDPDPNATLKFNSNIQAVRKEIQRGKDQIWRYGGGLKSSFDFMMHRSMHGNKEAAPNQEDTPDPKTVRLSHSPLSIKKHEYNGGQNEGT